MKKRRVTRKDVAEQAGVSVAVVSYVINDGPRPVSPHTRAKVERAIEELGYYPNELARSLRLQQSSTIGLVIPNLTNPVYAEIATSMEAMCTREGYLVLLGNSGRDPVRENKLVRMLRAKQVDGVVMIPTQDPKDVIALLNQARIPRVVLEHDLPDQHCIIVDDLAGGRLGTEHLLNLGHRRIALIRRTPSGATSSQRLLGYCQALETAGIEFDPKLVIECGPGQGEGYRAMQRLLELADLPTAVFTHNDVLAIGAMHAIRMGGLCIPEDMSVVGYDDTVTSAYLGPSLTTVKFPKEEMGDRAAHMILQLAQHKEDLPAQTLRLPVELVVRASTGPSPR